MLPSWINQDALDGWLEMRKKIKKSPTERAKEIAINLLSKLRDQGYDPNEILDQSTLHSWQGLFPTKEKPMPVVSSPNWHETASGIETKGRELGLTLQMFEGNFPRFKAAVIRAAREPIRGVA